MFFYAVFAIALLAKRRLVAGASVFLILFVILVSAPSSGGFFAPPDTRSITYFADPIILEFVFGMMIALLYRAGIRTSIPATIALIIVAFSWYAVAVPSVPRHFSCGIAAALIVAGMSLSSMPRPKGSHVIAGVVFLGDVSYALYLTHSLSFAFLAWIVTPQAINPLDHAWLYFGALLATALLISSVTHLVFEKPTTKFLQKLIRNQPPLPVNSVITTNSSGRRMISESEHIR